MTRGGVRNGAGRKPLEPADKKTLTLGNVRITPAQLAGYKKAAFVLNTKVSELVTDVLDAFVRGMAHRFDDIDWNLGIVLQDEGDHPDFDSVLESIRNHKPMLCSRCGSKIRRGVVDQKNRIWCDGCSDKLRAELRRSTGKRPNMKELARARGAAE